MDSEHSEHSHEDVQSDFAAGTGPSHRTTPVRHAVSPVESAAAVNPSGGPALEGDSSRDAGDAGDGPG